MAWVFFSGISKPMQVSVLSNSVKMPLSGLLLNSLTCFARTASFDLGGGVLLSAVFSAASSSSSSCSRRWKMSSSIDKALFSWALGFDTLGCMLFLLVLVGLSCVDISWPTLCGVSEPEVNTSVHCHNFKNPKSKPTLNTLSFLQQLFSLLQKTLTRRQPSLLLFKMSLLHSFLDTNYASERPHLPWQMHIRYQETRTI